MELLIQDLKHAFRMFRKNRAFTAAAIAALALGIGANTAIFSVVSAVLLKPLPFPDPDSVVLFMNTSPQGSGPAASPAKFAHWRQQTTVIQDATAFRTNVVNYTGGQFPEQLRAGRGQRRLLQAVWRPVVMGPHIHAGRRSCPAARRSPCSATACGPGASAADPNIIGKTISLSGDPYDSHRRHRPGVRSRRVRTGARSLDPVSARSQHRRSRSLLPGRRRGSSRVSRSSRRRRG